MTGMEAAIVSAVSTGLAVAQSKQQAKAQSRAMASQARAQLEEIEKRREIEKRQAREKLSGDLATQRARFGAAGLTSSRSADAILANLQRETERRLTDQDWFTDRDVAGIRAAASNTPRTNLLDFGQAALSSISGIANQLSDSTPKSSQQRAAPPGPMAPEGRRAAAKRWGKPTYRY